MGRSLWSWQSQRSQPADSISPRSSGVTGTLFASGAAVRAADSGTISTVPGVAPGGTPISNGFFAATAAFNDAALCRAASGETVSLYSPVCLFGVLFVSPACVSPDSASSSSSES